MFLQVLFFGTLLLFWVASLVAFLLARKFKIKWLRLISLITSVPLSALFIYIVCIICFDSIWYSFPKHIYHEAFNEDPPVDVTDIHSNRNFIGDSGRMVLRFRVSPQSFQNLFPQTKRKRRLMIMTTRCQEI